MVAEARKRHPALTFNKVDPTSLPFTDETFDAVLLFTVLTCIPTDDGQRRVLREASRVLRLGGILYISDLWLQ
jgi:ubiquinone/menaquinone biosynthesis C-methylase UbiE